MNLTSFTLASALRAGLLISVIAGGYLVYEHYRTKAVYQRTVNSVMQAMEAQVATHLADTQCLHIPSNPTIEGLTSQGLLSSSIVEQSLWALSIQYYDDDKSGIVMAKSVTLTASSAEEGEALKALGATTIGSWRYQAPALTIHRGINPETHIIDRLEFDPQTACFAR